MVVLSEDGSIISADGGGIVGELAPRTRVRLPLAPMHESEHNTIRAAIFPIACWKADDVNFDFDSSFVRPGVAVQTPRFRALMEQHPGAPLSIFGHADPVGNDAYNKALSGRRARAVYAMLTRDVKMWEELFGEGDLKVQHVQVMLRHLGFDPGRTDGTTDATHAAAVKEFQEKNGIANDGVAGAATRKVLYKAYMDAICVDDTGKPFTVAKTEFLAGGKDKGGKGDFQGCGEFNPVLVFSKEDEQRFQSGANKAERDFANAPNRRVMVLLFRPGSTVDPARWPCPRAAEGTAACTKRFWSDASERQKNTEEQREHQKTRDTFRCRFYQRMTDASPCERASAFVVARLYDHEGDFIAHAPYTLTLPTGEVFHDIADSRGFVTLPRQPEAEKGIMQWSTVPRTDDPVETVRFTQEIFFEPAGEDDASIRNRLTNLGYTTQKDLAEAVKAFFEDYHEEEDLDPEGVLGAKTRKVIVRVHADLADKIRTDGDDV